MRHFVEVMKRDNHNGTMTINMDGYTTFKTLPAVMHEVAKEVEKYDPSFARDLAMVKTEREAREYLQGFFPGYNNPSYIFEVEEVHCATKYNDDGEPEYKDAANYFHILFVIDFPDGLTVSGLLENESDAGHDEVKVVCIDGYDMGHMSADTAREMFGERVVNRFETRNESGLLVLVIQVADAWHRDGTPEKIVDELDRPYGEYMVRCYNRRGDLARTCYTDNEDDAAKIRKAYAAMIGIITWDRHTWSLYPTIWKKDDNGEFHRMTKYA